jgi:C4-dicarboxylate-specific signal transduction histidine kinase
MFFLEKKDKQGVGLGICLVRLMVRQARGQL